MVNSKDQTIGLRLRAVREELKLTLEELSSKAGFNNYQTLANIERGTRPAKAWELSKLSKFLYKDLWYFLSDEEPSEPVVKLAWRKKEENPNGLIECEARLRHLLENYRFLEELAGEKSFPELPPWEFCESGFSYLEVANKAEELVQNSHLGFRPGINLLAAFEDKYNFRIINVSMGSTASAAIAYGGWGTAIFINSDESPWRRNYSLAHELFHYFSNKTYSFDDIINFEKNGKRIEEKLADAFASALLLPKSYVTEEIFSRVKEDKISWIDLIDIAQEFGVSTVALLWRMVNLNIFSKDLVETLSKSDEFSNLDKIRRVGINQPGDEFSPKFVRLGLRALTNGLISKTKFCDMFGINKSEFASFIQSRGFSEELIYKQEIAVTNS